MLHVPVDATFERRQHIWLDDPQYLASRNQIRHPQLRIHRGSMRNKQVQGHGEHCLFRKPVLHAPTTPESAEIRTESNPLIPLTVCIRHKPSMHFLDEIGTDHGKVTVPVQLSIRFNRNDGFGVLV